MERRKNSRLPTNAFASMHYPPLGLLQVRISNFSDKGVFISLNNIHLCPYSEADIIECINDTLVPIHTRIVRVTDNGAGLEFLERAPWILSRLRKVSPHVYQY